MKFWCQERLTRKTMRPGKGQQGDANRAAHDKGQCGVPKPWKRAFVDGSDAALTALCDAFSNVSTWEAQLLHTIIKDVAEKLELGLGKVAQPLRIAVCGTGVSPSIDITLAILGKEKTLARLQRAITFIQAKVAV